MRIKFLRNYTVKAHDGATYTAGQVVDLRPDQAQHFINRGAAEATSEQPKSEPPKPAAKAGTKATESADKPGAENPAAADKPK